VIRRSSRILPVIVFSQFTGTSLWFAGNAVLGDLQKQWNLGEAALSYMTSSVQAGFIFGTLLFAFFTISDRFSPRIVFFICSLLGSLSNLCIYFIANGLITLLAFRFITGFFLAGIYPVGMKIAAGWFQRGLGQALGYLVGALVVGTAFPHLLKSAGQLIPWEQVVLSISGISLAGGLLMFFLVPDGPHLLKGTKFNSKAFGIIFKSKDLRCASFGYFGHMWELYTLWAFVPILFKEYAAVNRLPLSIPFWSFCVIAAGCLGCIGGGYLSKKIGSPAVAFGQLLVSGTCCLLAPILFQAPAGFFLTFTIIWGVVVVGDSPQFSTLTAQTAPQEFMGSALTIVTSIGFFITIFSIQFTNYLTNYLSIEFVFIFLCAGPLMGLIYLSPLFRNFNPHIRSQPDKKNQ
jgi:MFS family permease